MEDDVREWFIEMLWTCKHCQTRNPGMSGEERESLRCVTCGAEKSTEEWEMPDAPETAQVLSGKSLDRAKLSPNWHCLHCGTESRADKSCCEECGAPRVTATAAPTPNSRADAAVARNEPLDGGYRAPARKPEPTAAPTWPRVILRDEDFEAVRSETPWAKITLGTITAFLGIWFFVWLISPNRAIARVTQMRWERHAVLSVMHDYQGEGWHGDAPALVFEWTHCETRQHGTHACNPHNCDCRNVGYDCNCTGGDSYSCNCSPSCSTSCTSQRNGSARCRQTCRRVCDTCRTPRRCSTCYRTVCSTCWDQCPTMEQWCRYRYHQWDVVNQGHTQGDGHTARWPDLQANGDRERLERTETYRVNFADTASTRTWQVVPDFARYETFTVGERYRVEWTRAGGFTVLGRERP